MSSLRKQSEKTVSSFDAKTHLAQLIHDAENGQSIIITRRGKPVARIVPFEPVVSTDFGVLADEFRKFRSGIKGAVNVIELRDAGRKY
jgi:prevent-host-death family protein